MLVRRTGYSFSCVLTPSLTQATRFTGGPNHDGLRMIGQLSRPGIKAASGWDRLLSFPAAERHPRTHTLRAKPSPGYAHIYAYWPKQRERSAIIGILDGSCLPYSPKLGADGKVIGNQGEWLAFPTQYPDFVPMPNVLPQRGQVVLLRADGQS